MSGHRPACPTREHVVDGCGHVDVLKVLQCLRVEEAKGAARREGHPDTHTSNSHVGHHHALLLVGLQLALEPRDGARIWHPAQAEGSTRE